ncbi:MAG: acyl-CoA/acyl-ACP dehydrogenase [bacterium]|nr:acyl-CoA/acyl-ACP dehydrogenase [bacterium]
MDFGFSEEQTALRDLAKQILDDHCSHEKLKVIERDPDWFAHDAWSALGQASLLGVAIPESCGGSGLGFTELALLLEQVGASVAPVPAWGTLVLGALPIAAFGTPAQQERLLAPLAKGTGFVTTALTELPAEDPLHPGTTATRDGGGWRLEGVKDCVPAVNLGATMLIPARTGEETVGLFLVRPDANGVKTTAQIATNKEVLAEVRLADVRVGADDVLGDPTRGRDILAWLLPRAVAGLCAITLGVVERALRITARYTTERKQFDRPIGSFQAVHQRVGDAWIDVESIRLTAWQAVWRLEQGLPADDEVTIAKYLAGEAGHRVVYAAQHLHGGIGTDVDYPIHRYYLWQRALELTLGSGSRHLARLGSALAAA